MTQSFVTAWGGVQREGDPAAFIRQGFAFDQNSDSYGLVQGNPGIIIATVTIALRAQSRVRVDAVATILGSVAAGFAFLNVADNAGVVIPNTPTASQAFGTTQGTNFRTLNLCAVLDPQAAGNLVVKLKLDINGAPTSQINSSGVTLLALTEIFDGQTQDQE